jgi:WD40 repeat protein
MSRDEATPQEEQFAALLAAFDDALAGAASPPAAAPAEMQPRLEEDLKCLELLHQLRPPSATSGPQEPGIPNPDGRYTVLRLHAAGGLGQVWLVHDDDLDRDIALKELQPERAQDPAIAARFLREARITAQLQHPGIVPVYELVPATAGPNGPEPPFYTMRFLQGRTLTDAARAYHDKRSAGTAGPLDQTALLNAFVSVCNTVAYAHSRGVIHRDLKGQNVVLGDFGEVMVIDWGFAKTKDEGGRMKDEPEGASDSFILPSLSAAGQILGTPEYMAPEQAAGRAELIDYRTDVYGLGAILYELLTGQPPRQLAERSAKGTATLEVLRKVREEEPPPPEAVCPGVPPALASVCRRALAREPANRYPTVAELGREVQHWLADEPVAAWREPATARLRRWARRHKPAVAGLVVLLITVLVAVQIAAVLLQQEQAQTDAARAQAETVRAQASADKAAAERDARQALETQLYYHRIALAERERAANNLNRATQLLADCPQGLRGWEWYCLKRFCHADPMQLGAQQAAAGHSGAVSAIAFRPASYGQESKYLASAGHDRTVRLWDVTTGRLLRTFTGHTDVVYGLAWSPDGRRLATASWDGTVKVWDAADGRTLWTSRGHNEGVLRVVYSRDGRLLVSLSSHAVKVWDPATGKEIRTLGPVGGLNRYGLAISPDGRHVAVTTHHPAVILYDVETGEEVLVFRGHTSVVKNVTFSPDGRLAASGAGDIARSEPGEVRVWEVATGRELFRLSGHTDPIYGVAFSPAGNRLASASQDHTVKLWDTHSGQEVLTLRAHKDTVRAVAYSPDGWCLATACADGTIHLWDATPWADEKPAWQAHALTGHGAAVFSALFSGDGSRLFALSDNETIRTWDVTTARELPDQRLQVGPQIYTQALSPDGTLLATATSDGIVWLLDPATGQTRATLEEPSGPVKSLAFSPDGKRLAAAHWTRSVWVWDLETGEVLQVLQGHDDAVIGVAYSPDGRWLASASYDQTVRVWDAATGQPVHVLRKHTSRVFALSFSPDSRMLASASNDGTVQLWNPATGQALRTLTGHASGVHGVSFSPDGCCLASASSDWTVKLWDVASGTEIRTLRGHTDRVHSVAFTPDGRRLASASSDQTVRIWEMPPENKAHPTPDSRPQEVDWAADHR